ncbi:MAG: MerR family transcriptional regulator [Bacteroidales bacterium]
MSFKVEKIYYTIGEVAQLLDESPSLVRYWSQKFATHIKPARNKKGNRLFSPKDVENFKVIHFLVKERGFTLEGASERMESGLDEVEAKVKIVNILKGIKEQLVEVANALD